MAILGIHVSVRGCNQSSIAISTHVFLPRKISTHQFPHAPHPLRGISLHPGMVCGRRLLHANSASEKIATLVHQGLPVKPQELLPIFPSVFRQK